MVGTQILGAAKGATERMDAPMHLSHEDEQYFLAQSLATAGGSVLPSRRNLQEWTDNKDYLYYSTMEFDGELQQYGHITDGYYPDGNAPHLSIAERPTKLRGTDGLAITPTRPATAATRLAPPSDMFLDQPLHPQPAAVFQEATAGPLP